MLPVTPGPQVAGPVTGCQLRTVISTQEAIERKGFGAPPAKK